ncbi:MAG TPA: ankyrin repeat domain-containing protein [Rectinemataceae bacterium]|nr:ankyrin repeat domain-containing protein [Rectinemataceae bacterium]
MKVAVIGSPGDGDAILGILEALEKAGLESYGLKLYDSWITLSRGQLEAHLLKATHYLLVATESNVASLWFAFAGGYGLGRETGIAIFRDNPRRALPRYLAELPVIDTLHELIAYYEVERKEWTLQENRRSARAALLEMGISYHTDALSQCVAEGDSLAVELFLQAGFPPDARDKHGVPLLCLAARNKHRAVAEHLLERGASLDLQSEDRGFSPLMDAALAGSVDLVELFLSRGADPDLVSKDSQTALVVAVGRNDTETVKLLLAFGADPDIVDKLGLSARRYATLFGKPDIVPLFDSVPPMRGREAPR